MQPPSWIPVRRNYVGDGGFEKAIYVDDGEPKTTAKQWSERERQHWSVERTTRWVRVQGHGGEEVCWPDLMVR